VVVDVAVHLFHLLGGGIVREVTRLRDGGVDALLAGALDRRVLLAREVAGTTNNSPIASGTVSSPSTPSNSFVAICSWASCLTASTSTSFSSKVRRK